MVKAYSYIRMSTEIQLRGDSLRRQLELSQKYAAENSLELVDEIGGVKLQDIGVSGFHGKNRSEGALGVLIEALQKGEIEKGSYLLVESLDRISRESIPAALSLFMRLITSGLNVVTLSDGAVYSSETIIENQGMMFMSLGQMIRANDESVMKSKRLSAVWENKRKKIAEQPMTSMVPKWVVFDKVANKLVLDEARAKVVKEIFHQCANAQGIQGIAKSLNEKSIPVFGRSNLWSKSYISKILNNRAVLGEYQRYVKQGWKRIATGDPIKNYFPVVITEQEFIDAQAAMERRKNTNRGRKGPTFGNVFTGLMYCKHCNEKMQLRDRGEGPSGGKYLICKDKLFSGKCNSPDWKITELELLIFRHLKEVDLTSVVTNDKNKLAELDKRISSNDYEIEQLKRKKIRAVQIQLATDDDADVLGELVKVTNLCTQGIEEKTQENEKLVREKSEFLSATRLDTSDGLGKFIDAYNEKSSSFEFKSQINELLRRTISKIELKQTEFGIDPHIFEENSFEVLSYRKRSKKAATAKLNDIIYKASFVRHCEWLSRVIYIHYKFGEMRYISFKDDVTYKFKRLSKSRSYTESGD